LEIGLDPLVPEPDPTVAGEAKSLRIGLVSHWDFNGDLADSAGNFDGTVSGDVTFVHGKFDQGILLQHEGRVDILDAPNSNFEFEGKSFSIAGWIQFEPRSTDGGVNSLVQYGGDQSWRVLAWHRQGFEPEPGRSAQTLFLDAGVPAPELYVIAGHDVLFSGGSRHEFPRKSMTHVAVIYDSRINRTLNYVNGHLSEYQGEAIPAFFDPGFKIPAGLQISVGVTGMILLDDLAIWNRSLAPVEIRALYAEGKGKPLAELLSWEDNDEDGLPDVWEREHSLNLLANDSMDDPDGDGLTNLEEFVVRTDPRISDTDGDGALDGVETSTGIWTSSSDRGTDPFNADTDEDGLPDGVENMELPFRDLLQTGTDPNLRDTDGDGFSDKEEIDAGSDPTSSADVIELSDLLEGYWPLDHSADDALGVANGVIVGKPEFVDAEHRTGLQLDGVDQYVEIEDEEDRFEFPAGQSFTVSAWVRADPHPADATKTIHPTIVSKGQWPNWSFDLELDQVIPISATQSITLERGGVGLEPDWEHTRTRRIDDGRFHHVVAALDAQGDLLRVFLDGERVAAPNPSLFLLDDYRRGGSRGPRDPSLPLLIGKDPALVGIENGWSGIIDDVAVWARALGDSEVLKIYESNRSIGALINPGDTDHDGLEDSWEIRFGLEVGIDDGQMDPDRDGVSNLVEFARNTNPMIPDSDGDGLMDGFETGTGVWQSAQDTGTSPRNPDSDNDGRLDGAEHPSSPLAGANQASDPNKPDTDGDGVGDLAEALALSDPSDPRSVPGSHWKVRVIERDEPFPSVDAAVALLKSDKSDDAALVQSNWEEPVIDWVTEFISNLELRTPDAQGALEDDDTFFPHVRAGSANEYFALEAEGVIFVQTSSVVTFSLRTAGGLLSVDGEEVGRIEWPTPTKTKIYPVPLDAGLHQVKVISFGSNVSAVLELGVTGVPGAHQIGDAKFVLISAADPDHPFFDQDNDGLIDSEEFSFFPGDLTQLSRRGDWDNDGVSDGSEIDRGTNPISAANSLIALYTFDTDGEVTVTSNSAYLGSDATARTENNGEVRSVNEPLIATGESVAFVAGNGQRARIEAEIDRQNDFTLSLWFNAADTEERQILVRRGEATASPFTLFLEGRQLRWKVNDSEGEGFTLTSPAVIEPGLTYLVTVVHQNSPLGATLYIDGQQSAHADWNESNGWADQAELLMIGGAPDGEGFNGRLDQLAIYRRALRSEEVERLHSNPTELIADPTEASFWILSIELTPSGWAMRWTSEMSRQYEVEYSSDLELHSFSSIGQIEAQGITATFTDTSPDRRNVSGFYRIRL
ncbi:MAG: hypothetical protein KDN22_22965, partial [Verrucomicrobiae bacterium]|nr:hypothetical protein [Verrucomicrobiae bacterium]